MIRSGIMMLTGGAIGFACGLWWSHAAVAPVGGGVAHQTISEAPPTNLVTAVAVRRGILTSHLETFGQIESAPEAMLNLSVSFEARVSSISTSIGAKVSGDDPIMVLAPSADTAANLAQLTAEHQASAARLEQVRYRASLRLATTDEVHQAEQAADLARIKWEDWQRRIPGPEVPICASVSGVVNAIGVHVGQIVAPGTVLAEVIRQGRQQVRFGLDPDDAITVAPGTMLHLTALRRETPAAVDATLKAVSPLLDPTLHQQRVVADIPASGGLLDGEAVRVRIPVTLPEATIIPRDALVYDGQGTAVYIAHSDRAVRRSVRVIGSDGVSAAVSGDDLTDTDRVIVEGARDCTDGMAVTVKQ